jgi:hypothetical protein
MLGKLEGVSGFYGWQCFCTEVDDVPKPFIWYGRGPETSPFPEPLTYWAHLTRQGGGEQIPQVSVILRLIPGNVHGASLKPSELI